MRLVSILILSTCLLTGCTTFRSEVSSVNDTSLVGCCTYFAVPMDEEIDRASLSWRNVEKQLGKALASKGFTKTDSWEEADLMILVGTGIGDPRSVTYSVPLYGKTGQVVTGSQTTGSATTYGNTTYGSANTTYQTLDTYGVTGTRTSSETVFDRWLIVSAYDLTSEAEDGRPLESWRTTVRSSGSTGDLQTVIPYMLAAAQPYFGDNTSGQKQVDIAEGSKTVKALIE